MIQHKSPLRFVGAMALALAISTAMPLICRAQSSSIHISPQDTTQYSLSKLVRGLVANGIEIVDIKSNCSVKSGALGAFDDPGRTLGIRNGIILSTGSVAKVNAPNLEENYTSYDVTGISRRTEAGYSPMPSTPGDEDLSKEINYQTYDARTIELTFIPKADTFYYRYVFASEEYDEYVCSKYNDVFAFYLSEKGGPKRNIARTPNKKEAICINTVNAGNSDKESCPPQNSYLYKSNKDGKQILFDGFTQVLDVREKVEPGKTYVLKIAIADASDENLDSAVFLENSSISSYYQSFEINYATNQFDGSGKRELKRMVSTLKKHPKSKIEMVGHCDNVGTEEENMALSQKRVEWLKNYLVNQGIPASRIVATWQGEQMPRYETPAKNRRVEVFVTE
jgi:outer membrane protein OmpA-like peptidoglycan-associated protein